MIYTRRRARRLRMSQLAMLKYKVRDITALFINEVLPEMMAAIGIAIILFYLAPMFLGVIAAIGR